MSGAVQATVSGAGLARTILERLAIGDRVAFRYRTLERLGLEAMQRALGQGILREIHRAEYVPDPKGRTLYDLEVRHTTSQGIIAVHQPDDEWVDPVQLTEDDIRQFELVPAKLFRRICQENSIDDQVRDHGREVVFLGEREISGYGLRPIFFLYDNMDEARFVERCRGIGARGWTIILTPKPVDLSASNKRYLAESNIFLVAMTQYLKGDGWSLSWGRVVESLSGQGKVKKTYQPEEYLTFPKLPGLACSPDYRHVELKGKDFVLTETMVKVFKFMVENSPRGPREIPQARILEECESTSTSLVYIFKRLPDWKDLITQGAKKGTYRINV